ncbi:MAG: hypothetical protein OXE99_03385, partial [Cellvibrionales bacterium]|nr:hypothetical protein [Cellvibrionales bacterium]
DYKTIYRNGAVQIKEISNDDLVNYIYKVHGALYGYSFRDIPEDHGISPTLPGIKSKFISAFNTMNIKLLDEQINVIAKHYISFENEDENLVIIGVKNLNRIVENDLVVDNKILNSLTINLISNILKKAFGGRLEDDVTDYLMRNQNGLYRTQGTGQLTRPIGFRNFVLGI